MTMYKIVLEDGIPDMVYAASTTQALAMVRDHCLSVHKATDLEIAAHVRAGLHILGEPAPKDENQQELPV